MKRWIFGICVGAVLVYGFYGRLVDGFKSTNIHFPAECESWHLPEQNLALLEQVSKQPFTYLGKGRQCYVFQSEDGKWVLKFFKCQRLKLSSVYEYIEGVGLFSEKISAKRFEKEDRRRRLFRSAYIVATQLSNQAGIAYFQLSPSKEKLPTVQLKNTVHMSSQIDLAKTPFCLQRRGESVFGTLTRLFNEGRIELIKERLDQIITLLQEKRQKGVKQRDSALVTRGNIGFVEDRALFLDIGSFSFETSFSDPNHEKRQMKPLITWLKSKNKEVAEYFQERVNQL